jgi:dephospho-CoA kinase
MIIGITGTDGAGKGTVVNYLVAKHGYSHYSSRDLIMTEIARQGLSPNRSQMRLTANELREAHGNDVVVVKALERAREEGKTNVVIESVRALAEAEYLRSHGGIILAVDANPKVRFERVQTRRSATDKVTYEQFLKHEELEKNDPNPHGMQKAKVMEMADFTISNSESIADLQRQVEQFVKKFEGSK